MTYERGQYDDGFERERRPRRDVPERSERRTGSGSNRYSRSSERYARHASAQRDERRPGRSEGRPNRQRRDDAPRARQRDEQGSRHDSPRPSQRPSSRTRQRDDMRNERRDHDTMRPRDTRSSRRGYDDARDEHRRDRHPNRQREGRAEQQRDSRNGQHAIARAGQRNIAQANQYSRDRYVSQPDQQFGASANRQGYDKGRRVKPVDPRMILGLGVVAVILLAVIIIRFVAFGGIASEYGAAKAAIDQQQAQLTELQTSNGELQAEMDSMQGLIERYNNSGKK